jgi:hypothetical protein
VVTEVGVAGEVAGGRLNLGAGRGDDGEVPGGAVDVGLDDASGTRREFEGLLSSSSATCREEGGGERGGGDDG